MVHLSDPLLQLWLNNDKVNLIKGFGAPRSLQYERKREVIRMAYLCVLAPKAHINSLYAGDYYIHLGNVLVLQDYHMQLRSFDYFPEGTRNSSFMF